MAASHLDPLLAEAERRAVALVLRAHLDWTLGDVFEHLYNGPRGPALRQVTIGELLDDPEGEALALPMDGGPLIDRRRLELAKRAHGANFDDYLYRVLAEAEGDVAACYLTARVGGPPWKLRKGLKRLIEAGKAERKGKTSTTRYRALDAEAP
ncbi:hypothetical protein ENSA5_49150 [Enhygromyxa salina]|uniref:Uncharacterized protein n=1 Tax=Enhygromyxa salina TaxID=215803 RepID=A0A2S9XHU1_9BACT|nr:hypothetical protein [Enhygromyxa salina]PRP92407.1 hypothetical protein ENSA5_49150 [Enhygromyxa salina]